MSDTIGLDPDLVPAFSISLVALRIADALPATIDGRSSASEDQEAMHAICERLRREHPSWSSHDHARMARALWVTKVLGEGN